MSRKWIIADLHFNHSNIIKYEDRPFNNVEEMNKEIIKRWNNKVSKDDTVYILGDFTLSRRMDIIKYFTSSLNGNKILVMGNHDTRKPKDYIEAGFKQATRKPIMIEEGVILMHEPFNDSTLISPDYLYFFGHVHSNKCLMDEYDNCKCVSIERLDNYEPADFDILLRDMKKKNKLKENYLELSRNIINKLCEDDSEKMLELYKERVEGNNSTLINLIKELYQITKEALIEERKK